ncbi:unnamed protein product [Musa hybrid cultivar]
MADQKSKGVKLYGTSFNGHTTMVECALRLKGVAYEYVEEDRKNKSEALLKLNPVHKQVPVLVVDGKPVAESHIILQHIDDVWKDPPHLPEDPYKRAKVRFWADFVSKKVVPIMHTIVTLKGDEQKTAVDEFGGYLQTMEDGIREELWTGGPFINGDNPGLLDVVMGSSYTWIKFIEAVAGVKLAKREETPLLCSSMEAFVELDAVKELMTPPEVLLQSRGNPGAKTSATSDD